MRLHVNKCIVGSANGKVAAVARHKGNLYQTTFTEVCGVNSTDYVHSHAGGDSAKLWHYQLGHLDVKSVYVLQSMVKGINLGETSPPNTTLVCQACIEGKQYATKWGNDAERLATKPLKIVHLDVCGPMRTTFIEGRKYFCYFH